MATNERGCFRGAEIRREPERRRGLSGTAARVGTADIGAVQAWGERRGCWASELESTAGMEEERRRI